MRAGKTSDKRQQETVCEERALARLGLPGELQHTGLPGESSAHLGLRGELQLTSVCE